MCVYIYIVYFVCIYIYTYICIYIYMYIHTIYIYITQIIYTCVIYILYMLCIYIYYVIYIYTLVSTMIRSDDQLSSFLGRRWSVEFTKWGSKLCPQEAGGELVGVWENGLNLNSKNSLTGCLIFFSGLVVQIRDTKHFLSLRQLQKGSIGTQCLTQSFLCWVSNLSTQLRRAPPSVLVAGFPPKSRLDGPRVLTCSVLSIPKRGIWLKELVDVGHRPKCWLQLVNRKTNNHGLSRRL